MAEYERPPTLTGRASGRPAPRAHSRIPAREATLVEHGLLSPGDANPAHGQLFDPSPYDAHASVADSARAHNTSPPLASSEGGFLPRIGDAGNRSAHSRKIAALRSYSETRAANPIEGANPNIGAVAQTMDHLSSQLAGARPTDWYSRRDEYGHVTEGRSTEMVRDAAHATGTGMSEMTRAAAQMSPRMPWSEGNPLHRTFPNLEVTRSVAEATKGLGHLDDEKLRQIAVDAPGQGLPLSKERAGMSIARPETAAEPLPAGENYQKVPNFNESLSFSREDLPQDVRRAYAGSYTQDVHDLTAHGMPEGLHNKRGQYDVSAMAASRVAFKNRMLPPNMQADIWETVRPPEPLTVTHGWGQAGGPVEQQSLFREDGFSGSGGKLSPQFDFTASSRGTVRDDRSEYAKSMGLDF